MIQIDGIGEVQRRLKSPVERLGEFDWQQIGRDLDRQGNAVMQRLLSPEQCRSIAGLYSNDDLFRSHVVMGRHGFGRGEYKYFSYPLPDLLDRLRTGVYPYLVGVANRWNEAMGIDTRYPDTKSSADRPLRDELDLFLLLPKFPRFLSVMQQIAPGPLAQAAAGLAQKGPAGWQHAIENFWHRDPELASCGDDIEPAQAFGSQNANSLDRQLPWIFLQPYAEYLADHREIEIVDRTPSTCPLCGCKPVVGVLRSEGDGAKKSLVCMLCAHEWVFRRIYCPACGEEREPQMAYYSAPEIAHVRVDVCDTCHTYLKSVDLTKTGLAVAVVDELATVPLDLWAREHGYEKLQMNLLGT